MRLASPALALIAWSASAPTLCDAQNFRVFGLNYNSRIGPDWALPANKCKSADAVKQDLATIAKVTDIVRLYSLVDCDQGEVVIPAALAAGLKVSVGLWVSDDPDVFRNEKAKLEELIKPERGLFSADKIFDIHVGSEAIYRKEVTPETNIEYLREVKKSCGAYANSASIPVTIAEIGDTYLAHPELVDAVDVVSANGFPFWEKWPVETAATHFLERMTPLFKHAASKNKEVFISETGWASGGVSAKASVASPANAKTYFRDFTAMAKKFGWKYFYFAAFDEAWKIVGPEAEKDTVEAHFGLFKADRTLKDEFQSGMESAVADTAAPAAGTNSTNAPTSTPAPMPAGTLPLNGNNGTSGGAASDAPSGRDKCPS